MNPLDNPVVILTILMAVVATGGLLFYILPGLLKNSLRESQLRNNRADALKYALSMLKSGMPCHREILGEGRTRPIFAFYQDGVLIRHYADPQEDVICLSVGNEKRLEISIKNDKIDGHLTVTDEEHEHARQILVLLREAEAKIAKK